MAPMTLLYRSDVFFEHDTARHPESAARLRAVHRHLDHQGIGIRCRRLTWQPVSPARLARLHSPAYVQQVQQFAVAGGGWIEGDTLVSPRSFDVALLAAGAVCDAVERVVGGEQRCAFCLVRPPGHHALARGAMGFCLFNNIAIGAAVATEELGVDRVLIVDWDVHHGNGTQDAFWESERVGFFSVHRHPFYPGTGLAGETGGGPGLGATWNLPLPFGIARGDYLKAVGDALDEFCNRLRPELLLVSAGFDAHALDPVGSLGLEVEDFAALGRLMLEVADAHCGGRIVSALEGGYNPQELAESVGAYLDEMLEQG
jgi:acetoin utilization deacetylase AcuC-like enzyme